MEPMKEKRKPGRTRKDDAAKNELLKEKEDAKRATLTAQQENDLTLLRITKTQNPFRLSLNKRKDLWQTVVSAMNKAYPKTETDDRRCRERVKKLMDKYRKESLNVVTGTGTTEPSEQDSILEFLINQDDMTANNREAEKEKEETSRRLTEKIQRDACDTFSSIAVQDDSEDHPEC